MTRRRSSNNPAVPVLALGLLAGVAIGYGLVGAAMPSAEPQPVHLADAGRDGGHSVHLKNRGTPEWMLELQARQAQQAPFAVGRRVLSFWI